MKGLLLASKFASVMSSVGGILLAVVILLAMVTIHEFGHYVAGKLLGFKITEFSVGFGSALFKKRSKKTGELFALRVVPLGGYCAFAGEDEYEDEGFDFGDEDSTIYEVECPVCGEIVNFDEETLEAGAIACPGCGESLEFSLDEEDEE